MAFTEEQIQEAWLVEEERLVDVYFESFMDQEHVDLDDYLDDQYHVWVSQFSPEA